MALRQTTNATHELLDKKEVVLFAILPRFPAVEAADVGAIADIRMKTRGEIYQLRM
jgi:hypothetical protein